MTTRTLVQLESDCSLQRSRAIKQWCAITGIETRLRNDLACGMNSETGTGIHRSTTAEVLTAIVQRSRDLQGHVDWQWPSGLGYCHSIEISSSNLRSGSYLGGRRLFVAVRSVTRPDPLRSYAIVCHFKFWGHENLISLSPRIDGPRRWTGAPHCPHAWAPSDLG